MILRYKLLLLDWSYNVAPLGALFSYTSIRYFQNDPSSFCGLLTCSCVEIDGTVISNGKGKLKLHQFKKKKQQTFYFGASVGFSFALSIICLIVLYIICYGRCYTISLCMYIFKQWFFSLSFMKQAIFDNSNRINVQRIMFIHVD